MPGSPAVSADPARLAALDAELIALHDHAAPARLCALHAEAARLLADPGAQRFHLTHAWVRALEAGMWDEVASLEDALRELGGL